MSTWENLERKQITNIGMIHEIQCFRPLTSTEDRKFLNDRYDNCEIEIDKIKDTKTLPEIISFLKEYNYKYNSYSDDGKKYTEKDYLMYQYIIKRISKYEKELIQQNAKEKYKDKIERQIQPDLKCAEVETQKVKKITKETKPTKKRVSATLKRLVWNTHIGEEIGKAKCLCCKSTDITQMSFHCGHVIAEANGGELIVSNLRPICQNCNSSMGTKNKNDFMESFK